MTIVRITSMGLFILGYACICRIERYFSMFQCFNVFWVFFLNVLEKNVQNESSQNIHVRITYMWFNIQGYACICRIERYFSMF